MREKKSATDRSRDLTFGSRKHKSDDSSTLSHNPISSERFEDLKRQKWRQLHILTAWNPKSHDSSTFSTLRTIKVTTVLHFRTEIHGRIKKTFLQQTAPRTWLSGLESIKVMTVLHFRTILYLRNLKINDSYTFWGPKNPKVKTVIHSDTLEPQKSRLFYISNT